MDVSWKSHDTVCGRLEGEISGSYCSIISYTVGDKCAECWHCPTLLRHIQLHSTISIKTWRMQIFWERRGTSIIVQSSSATKLYLSICQLTRFACSNLNTAHDIIHHPDGNSHRAVGLKLILITTCMPLWYIDHPQEATCSQPSEQVPRATTLSEISPGVWQRGLHIPW